MLILVIGATATTGLQFKGIQIGHWVTRGIIAVMLGILVWEYVRSRRAGRRFVPPSARQLIVPGLFVVAGAVAAFLIPNMMWGVTLIVIGGLILSVNTAGNVEDASVPQDATKPLGG